MPAATVEAAAPANTQQKFDQAQAEFRAKRVVTKADARRYRRFSEARVT